MPRARFPRVDRKTIIRRALTNRVPRRLPPSNVPPTVPYPSAQQLAGTTVTQTTGNRNRLAPGYGVQYGPDGKPMGFVRINQPGKNTGSVGIAQGYGVSYDASGKASFTRFPKPGGGSGQQIGANETRVVSPGTFGDAYYRQQTQDLGGVLPRLDESVTNQNAYDTSYLIQMGYTPEQAKAAIQSNGAQIIDPNNPTGTINKDIGTLNPGALDWNQVDVANPYSRAGMLVTSYRGAVQGTTTGMAAGGHGRSGAALTGQQANSTNFGSGQAQWNADLTGRVTDSNVSRRGFATGANLGIQGAMQEFISDPKRNNTGPAVWTDHGHAGKVTTVPSVGTYILGSEAAKAAGVIAPSLRLANNWSVEVKDGRVVRFIPPGGK